MKNFLLLLREEVEEMQKLSPQEFQQLVEAHMNWVRKLTEKGIYKGGEGLDTNGKTINNASMVVTDGPYIEAKECVGGFYIIQADDLDQALEITRDCPSLKYNGSVEIRPIAVY